MSAAPRAPIAAPIAAARGRSCSLPEDADIWSVCIHPKNPRIVYAGATPPGVYRSDDGGDTWRKMADPGLPDRVIMGFACRVMRLDVDPNSPDDVYATLEANGAMRSRNRGESWEDCTADLIRFCEEPKYRAGSAARPRSRACSTAMRWRVSAAAPGTVFLANRMGLFRSNDRGEHWQDMEINRFSPLTYGRDIRVSPHDPKVMYACLSPAARSTDGSIYRSDDVGQTWKRFDHGVKAEATMMGVAVHPTRPEPGLRRLPLRPGVRHPGRRPQLERDAGCPKASATSTPSPAAERPSPTQPCGLGPPSPAVRERGFKSAS